jgi:hypothetical protein
MASSGSPDLAIAAGLIAERDDGRAGEPYFTRSRFYRSPVAREFK